MKDSLNGKIKNHPVYVYGFAILIGISITVGFYETMFKTFNIDRVAKGSYILINKLDAEYVKKSEYVKALHTIKELKKEFQKESQLK